MKKLVSPIDKKNILIACLLVALIASSWYVFAGVSSNRSAIDAVRAELSDVRTKQQSAIDRLDKIESGLATSINTVGAIESSVSNVADTISISQGRIADSAGAIEPSKRILNDIRKTGQ